ncbi:MAG: hypothetical protein ABEK50_06550 [bacterium]
MVEVTDDGSLKSLLESVERPEAPSSTDEAVSVTNVGRDLSDELIDLLDLDRELAKFMVSYENRFGSRKLKSLVKNTLNESNLELRPDSTISSDPT